MARDPAQDTSPAALRPGTRVAAVVSTYHAELVEAMLASAARELAQAGLADEDLLVVRVPGAFELPIVARSLALRDDVDAVLCLGLVLKGETAHDEYIARATAAGIQDVALATGTPVLFGVLTCETLDQARARALPPDRGGREDKGREVARAAVAVLAALREVETIGKRASPAGFGARASAGSGDLREERA